jgi:hypothetical protein
MGRTGSLPQSESPVHMDRGAEFMRQRNQGVEGVLGADIQIARLQQDDGWARG